MALTLVLGAGCASSTGGGSGGGSDDGGSTDTGSSSQLDDAGRAACSYFPLAKAKAGYSNAAGIEEIRKGLATAQESGTPGLASDLANAVDGFTADTKAEGLIAVCKRYGY